jgi:hypothetical protein
MAGAKKLAEAVNRAGKGHQKLTGEVEKLMREVARGDKLAEEIDAAVQAEDKRRVEQVIRESGVTSDVKIEAVSVSSNAKLELKICIEWDSGTECYSCECEF